MTKQHNNLRLGFSIHDYAGMAMAFLLSSPLSAQVSYTDLDPDVVLNTDGEQFGVDMDNDGAIDFNFSLNTGNYSTYYSSEIRHFRAFYCGPVGGGINAIAGSSTTVGSAAYSTFITYRPFALPENAPVDIIMPFQAEFMVMAYVVYNSFSDLVDLGGRWWPGVDGGFVGVRFNDAEENLHYGWIRVTIQDTVKTLTIHDYAYETIPNKGIITGDEVGVAVNNSPSIEPVQIRCDGQTIVVHVPESGQMDMQLQVLNLEGALVYTEGINQVDTELILDLPNGPYVVRCFNSEISVNKKIFIIQ